MFRYTDRAPPGCHRNSSLRRDVAGAGCPLHPRRNRKPDPEQLCCIDLVIYHATPSITREQKEPKRHPTQAKVAPYHAQTRGSLRARFDTFRILRESMSRRSLP